MLKINMGAHKGCRCRNGTILGISLILIFSSARMALAAENAVKQAETAVIVGYSVSFIDAENANHLIFHTQTGKVLEGTSLNVSFPEQIIGSDGHIWKSAVQSPQIFELYGTGTEKIYIKYERGGKVPEIGAEEDTAMLALRKRLERWKQSAWEAECAIFGREDAAVSGSGSGLTVQNQSENDARIRNLVSAIGDAAWHEFYLIGQDFTPSAKTIGV